MPNRDGTGPRHGGGPGRGGQGGRAAGQGRGFGARRGGAPLPPPDGGLTAVSALGDGLDAAVDARFGRAAGFVLVDGEGALAGHLDNAAADAMGHGAGLAAAEAVVRAGAKTVLTGRVGPKASAALAAAGVRVVEGCDGMSVAAALDKAARG
ncbi:NifB/NifX family molybdenum-iron cluster-binding protein [Oleispirillum naphthae]|uniref:NifB/NifX family molybdenum-iron cluster-binding protein n=1 Tax=Oleispirillum naphthae TaxID=2838853 RepID=UPI0030824079